MTIDAHAQAMLALLAPVTVHDGKAPTAAALPYTLVYFTYATPGGEVAPDKVPLTLASSVVDMSAYCHNVGANAQAARLQSQKVRAVLLNVVPVVASRVCFPLRHVDAVLVDRDETTGTPVFDMVDVYRLVSVPA